MNSPNVICAVTSSHQAIMKCPWQWRQPFLDEKLASRKRKVGDGYFYDPVDPSFVDHLLPGYAKKVCESDEKEKIQLEIQRLMLKNEERAAGRLVYDALVLGGAGADSGADSAATPRVDSDSEETATTTTPRKTVATATSDKSGSESAASSDDEESAGDDMSQENLALVDSILLMTKAVDESSLLASPKSVSSPLSPLLGEDEEEPSPLSLSQSASDASFVEEPLFGSAPSLELVSDNLQDNYFASEDSDLLDFPTATASE
ncbi:hypothetical protein PybrP1_001981 [[Pythium] brassicae (nom. inval.)]|nr:hypothetical protein PybrP1_001981 [[Pythium] brassicae (nom. inval.)]